MCQLRGFVKNPAVNRRVAKLFAEKGADAWYTPEADTLLPADTKCGKCGGLSFKKEMDIIDVWFESGSSHAAVLGHVANLRGRQIWYLEGGDQYRGWFHSSLLCAVARATRRPTARGQRTGWTLDEQGRAMSKSLATAWSPWRSLRNSAARLYACGWLRGFPQRCGLLGQFSDCSAWRKTTGSCVIRCSATSEHLVTFSVEDAVPYSEMHSIDSTPSANDGGGGRRSPAGTQFAFTKSISGLCNIVRWI